MFLHINICNMYDIKIIFGSNVRKLRNKLNLSQDQFSEKIAIGPTTLSVIESGKSFTTSDTINNICTTFNIPASYLFEIDSRYITNEYGNKKEIVDDIKLLLNTLDYDKLKLTVNFIQMLGENTSVASIKSKL